MTRLLRSMALLLLCLLVLPIGARAADVATKAPLFNPQYPDSGFYAGGGVTSGVTNATAAAPGAGVNLYTAGAGITGLIGRDGLIGGSNFWFAELAVTYQNLGATSVCGAAAVNCSVTSTWSIDGFVGVGCPWTMIFAVFPAIANAAGGNPVPPLPANASLVSSKPYCGGGFDTADVSSQVGLASAREWRVNGVIGLGLLNRVIVNGAPTLIDTRAYYEPASAGLAVGPVGYANPGSRAMARVAVKF